MEVPKSLTRKNKLLKRMSFLLFAAKGQLEQTSYIKDPTN